MPDQVATAAQNPAYAAQANRPTPYLKITVTGTDGAQVMPPITIRIPSELSLRIATMHVMEFVMKEFKRIGFKDALKAIGLK